MVRYVSRKGSQTNATFAKISNEGRDLEDWVSAYEPDAGPVRRPRPVVDWQCD
jgi:hypothetical protein